MSDTTQSTQTPGPGAAPPRRLFFKRAAIATAIAGTHTCAPAPRHLAITQTRWATCAAGKPVVQGPHGTGARPQAHKSSHS